MRSTCILIDATRADDFELFQFDSIRDAASAIADVYLITNGASVQIRETHLNISNEEIFSTDNNIKRVDNVVPGNPDLKLLALLKRPEMARYENFVRIEYDCVFSGRLRETIIQLVKLAEQYDVGFSSCFPNAEHSSDWPWWKTFENWKDPTLPPPGSLYAAFLPVLIFNRRFIEAYQKHLTDGWRGHYEMMVPSVAHWESMRTIDFGRNKNFNIDQSVFTVHSPAEFDSPSSKFFHPVKTFDNFRCLPTRTLKNYALHASDQVDRFMKHYANEKLSSAEFDLIKKRLRCSDNVLVYGAPGVVEAACSFGVQYTKFLTSDRRSVDEVTSSPRLRRDIESGNLKVQFINIGKTTGWGNPGFPEEPAKWSRYINSITGREYNTIVVAGRFRVALSANIYVRHYGSTDPDVIVTNFKSRDHYHALLQIYEVAEEAGNIVRLQFKENMVEAAESLVQSFSGDYR